MSCALHAIIAVQIGYHRELFAIKLNRAVVYISMARVQQPILALSLHLWVGGWVCG